jgi:hypothetical protein
VKRLIATIFAGMVALLPTIAPAGSSEAAQAILPANQVATGRDPRALADGIK